MPVDDVKERLKAIEMAVGQIEKQFGKGAIMRLGAKGGVQPHEAISTGSISIDYALGIDGLNLLMVILTSLVTMLAVAAITFSAPNQVGTLTFLVLWTMRLSAKLNLFLGVRNLATEFIPAHLRYLLSYFPKARLNPLMPLSILGGSAVAIRLFFTARESTAAPALEQTLVGTLLALAVLEHLFLALPLPDAMLWRWALRRGAQQAPKSQKA